jgi:hypothetical protein
VDRLYYLLVVLVGMWIGLYYLLVVGHNKRSMFSSRYWYRMWIGRSVDRSVDRLWIGRSVLSTGSTRRYVDRSVLSTSSTSSSRYWYVDR